MKDLIKIVGIVCLLLGACLIMGMMGGGVTDAAPNGKGVFLQLVHSGSFTGFGLILAGIGCLCLLVQMLMRE